MSRADIPRLKATISAAPSGRDRMLVLVAVVAAGRCTVDELRAFTVDDARRLLRALDKRPFSQSASRYLERRVEDGRLGPDDFLFPSQKLDKKMRTVKPIGRVAAWRILSAALRASLPPDPLDEATGFVDMPLTTPPECEATGFSALRTLTGRRR